VRERERESERERERERERDRAISFLLIEFRAKVIPYLYRSFSAK